MGVCVEHVAALKWQPFSTHRHRHTDTREKRKKRLTEIVCMNRCRGWRHRRRLEAHEEVDDADLATAVSTASRRRRRSHVRFSDILCVCVRARDAA